VINASSSYVYGDNGADLQTESSLPAPRSPYGFSKWLGEIYALQSAQLTQIETISLRYFNVFGPRQNLDGVLRLSFRSSSTSSLMVVDRSSTEMERKRATLLASIPLWKRTYGS
jgi:nucleoside-diphosphate-sugar epimerase